MRPAPSIVFDLDDTLYLERDFARSGYAAAAQALAKHHAVENFAETCLALLDGGRRQRIFDEALLRHGIVPDADLVGELVRTYRTHEPRIELAADASRYLAPYGERLRGALVTDGFLETQEAKIEALGLHAILECIVCTGRLGPGMNKPHPRAFEIVEEWARPFGSSLVYVADNPSKDFLAPRSRGWATVEIRRPHRIHCVGAPGPAYEAHATIESLDDLDACIEEVFDRSGIAFA